MSDTNRTISHRRPAVPARHASVETGVLVNSPSRVEGLRKLVASGQYQVSPRWLAAKIFRAAGVIIPE
jgi:anti-sigma28 factor (negative regulator of flagellin synthesis)